MIALEVAAVILLGIAAGAAAGLFGVGGGIVFVPTLTIVLGLTQLHAEATSLLAIIPVAVLGSWRQTRAGTVRWRDATTIGLASVVSVVAGALVADAAPERVLRIGFAILLGLTAVQLVGAHPSRRRGPHRAVAQGASNASAAPRQASSTGEANIASAMTASPEVTVARATGPGMRSTLRGSPSRGGSHMTPTTRR